MFFGRIIYLPTCISVVHETDFSIEVPDSFSDVPSIFLLSHLGDGLGSVENF